MDEVIEGLAAEFGVDRPTIEKALGIILDFLEGSADQAGPLLARLPGDGDRGMGAIPGLGQFA